MVQEEAMVLPRLPPRVCVCPSACRYCRGVQCGMRFPIVPSLSHPLFPRSAVCARPRHTHTRTMKKKAKRELFAWRRSFFLFPQECARLPSTTKHSFQAQRERTKPRTHGVRPRRCALLLPPHAPHSLSLLLAIRARARALFSRQCHSTLLVRAPSRARARGKGRWFPGLPSPAWK